MYGTQWHENPQREWIQLIGKKQALPYIYIYIYIHIKIEKVDMFRKVLNKQFIEKLRAIFIINKFVHNKYIYK